MKVTLHVFPTVMVVALAFLFAGNANAVHVPTTAPDTIDDGNFMDFLEVKEHTPEMKKKHPAAQASYLEMQVKLIGDAATEGIRSGINKILGSDVDIPIFSGHENGGNCYCCGCEVSCRECKRDFDVCCTV